MSPTQEGGTGFGPDPGTWYLDPLHSSLIFVAHYLCFGRVQGTFGRAKGLITVAEDPTRSTVDVTIMTESVNTGVRARDTHLRSPDFLDTEKYPELRFTGTRIEPKGHDERSFRTHGDATIHGTTRPITLNCQWAGEAPDYTNPDEVYGQFFAATTQIRLSDFGVGDGGPVPWGGRLVGDTVDVVLEVRLQNRDPAPLLAAIGHAQ